MNNVRDAGSLRADTSSECVIIANGPSLNDVPRGFLWKFPTFGVNQIWKMQGFTPTYYAAVHPEVRIFAEQVNAMRCRKFVTEKARDVIGADLYIKSIKSKTFSKTPHNGLWEGWSTIYVALQLAYWLGYRTALLVGLDHDKSGSFVPDYYDGLPDEHKRLDDKDPDKLLPAFRLAKQYWEADGRRIINLTPNTKEPVFEKGYITKWYPSLLLA